VRLVSWNVNGLRACMQKGFPTFFQEVNADVFCIQETKMQKHQVSWEFDGYYEFWFSAKRPGYSGTLIYTKYKPLSVRYGLDDGLYQDEGRVLTVELDNYFVVNVYVPNVKRDLSRLPYRMKFDEKLRAYLLRLSQTKDVIVCGDFNVAHQEIDLVNPSQNKGNAGFTEEERNSFSRLLDSGFNDVFRQKHPQKTEYTWWSYMFKARERNIGWRLDYFLTSKNIPLHLLNITIYKEIFGSDHCPVMLEV